MMSPAQSLPRQVKQHLRRSPQGYRSHERALRHACESHRPYVFAARAKDFSIPAEAPARIELLLRRGSSRGGAPKTPALKIHLCAASRLPLSPPRFGNAATLTLCGPWIYVVG